MALAISALFTFTGRISAKREASDVVVFDEGIALAISEEKNATDERLAAGLNFPEKVNKAAISLSRYLSYMHNSQLEISRDFWLNKNVREALK